MSTRTQTSSSPFTRLSLIGKGSQTPTPRGRPAGDDDYIPYTGPYEEPPRRRQERSRDSWGDPLYEEDGNDMIQELHQRYVSPDRAQYPWREENEERKSRPRARTHSGVSGRTISSGTVDPHRASVSVLRKTSHHSNAVRPPVPSYINLDAAGGVGDSPAPPPRFSREAPPPKRSSLASIFTFGQASKKLPVSPAKVALPTSPPATSPLATAKSGRVFAIEPQRPASGPPSIYSVSSDKHQSSYASHSQEGDPYHSYYNYTPAVDQFGEMSSPHNATPPPHPYAYGSPHHDIPDPPQTAPLATSPKLKFTQPPHRLAFPQPDSSAVPPHLRSLKTYASTPNLRETSLSPNRLRNKALPPLPPKGKDRWLSAETWCDAIMFPRPRLKAEDAQLILRGASGRIVSPPGSPVVGGFNAPPKPDRPEGMVSRVLAHSRSMVSLNAEAGTSRTGAAFRGAGPIPESPPPFVPPPITVTRRTETPTRPKSFAWDDLALPSPVPSLARVLEEGQILEHQRKKWQMQAAGSFQNTRARSLSRSRAKSLTQRGGKAGQSNLDFLAARSLLGNQDVVPVLPTRLHARTTSQSGTNTNTNGTTTFNTRTSHSHSNSLVKTMSKSSHGHSRQESWGRSALNKAAALCQGDGVISPVEEKTNGLESALRMTGTKVIRLADPAMLPVDTGAGFGAFSPRNGVSPTPSAVSDAQMGIALGTPPGDNSSFERDSIHLPSHPYAQGGVSYPYQSVTPAVAKGAGYAGPHPAAAVVNPNPQDFSARHRLPPQASLTYHPYAAPSSRRESYQVVSRMDSDVPPASKMWAQLSPGFIREILPGELLYSPFMSERSTTPEEQQREPNAYGQNRKSTATILDTVGLGEALATAVEEEHSRDSGLGTSEDHAPHAEEWADDGQAAAVEAHHPYRIHRKPVQYDVSRPPYAPKKSGVSTTNHTAASSPVDPSVSHEHRLTPPTPPLPTNPSPGMTSLSSSPPRSPPPVGSVDDLDDFRDLFYKPNLTDEVLNNLSRPTSTRQQSITWDIASTTRTQRTRTGSGLTSLARQLSQEFEEMRAIHHRARTDSMGSDSSISRFSGRFPTENDIQFIFSESEMPRSVGEDLVRPGLPEEAMSAFHASGHTIPEDVESSRTSLDGPVLGKEEEDDHEIRVGNVESVSTPPATSTDYRNSYTGQMLYAGDHAPKEAVPIPRASHLQPHSADPTRSSYMTESDLSRMSNLSDFPAPPPQHMTPAHMSLLTSYFHEAVAERSVPEDESIVTFTPRIGARF